MDFRALIEALSTFLLTPVISIAMVLVIFTGLLMIIRKVDRR